MKVILFYIIFLYFLISISFAQEKNQNLKNSDFKIYPRLKYGFIMPHHQSYRYFIKKHTKSLELNFGFNTSGKKLWHQLYNFPVVGFGIYFANLGNKDVLGNVKSIYWYYNNNLYSSSKVKLNFIWSFGFSYLNKVFDAKTNYINIATSSKLNAHITLGFESRIKIFRKVYLINGFDFTHLSNGSIKMPNRGLNLISYRLGFDYVINEKVKEKIFIKEKYKKNYDFFINYSFGIKKTLPVSNPKKYFISIISADFGKNISYKSRFGLGIDIVNNPSKKILYEKFGIYDTQFTDFVQVGAHFSYDLKIGNASLQIHQGYYFYSKIPKSIRPYNRVGFKMKINKFMFINLTLNSYFLTADWIEWGFGIYL